MSRSLRPSLCRLVGGARADLLAGREDDLAGLAVDDVEGRLLAAPLLGDERDLPAVVAAHEGDAVVEGVEDLLARHVERVEQGGDRQLALAVDADVDDVLGVELEVEPRAAIGDDAGGEQILARGVGLAAVMVEQHARRAVHLADDDALGAVDDERAVLRHQRHVAHVDVLLLDIEHGAGLGIGIDLEHDQAQRDAHRRGIGHAALAALVGVVFGIFELVMDEIELGGAGEVADREDRAQGLLEAGDIAVLRARAEELLVALALNLDQVRHFGRLRGCCRRSCGCAWTRWTGSRSPELPWSPWSGLASFRLLRARRSVKHSPFARKSGVPARNLGCAQTQKAAGFPSGNRSFSVL